MPSLFISFTAWHGSNALFSCYIHVMAAILDFWQSFYYQKYTMILFWLKFNIYKSFFLLADEKKSFFKWNLKNDDAILVFRREPGIALVVDHFWCQIWILHKISHKKPPELWQNHKILSHLPNPNKIDCWGNLLTSWWGYFSFQFWFGLVFKEIK